MMSDIALRLVWTHACAFCMGVIFSAVIVSIFGRRNG